MLALLLLGCDDGSVQDRMARPREARSPGAAVPAQRPEAAPPAATAVPLAPTRPPIPVVALGASSSALATGSEATARSGAKAFTAQVKRCYTAALAQDDQVEGTLTVSWELRHGKVLGSAVTTDTTADVGLQDCVEAAARKAKFNASLNGQVDFAWELAARPAG